MALPSLPELDVERLVAAGSGGSVGAAALDEFERLNGFLWQEFARLPAKLRALPMVRRQLDVLTGHLKCAQSESTHHRLCALAGDLFQLCGEILFDVNCYSEAAHCYALAAGACKEADAPDLWACAMTRHAFIGVYERRFDQAAPLLEGAAVLARRGDSTLPTRQWVAAVQAQTFAGLGDSTRCQRALEAAERVTELDTSAATGWLRFTGSRLDEERGGCLVELGHPELAEPSLNAALDKRLSMRRRGAVLADLATIGAQRNDAEQAVHFGGASLDAARQTGSAGYVGRKLAILRPQLKPMLADRHVRHLDHQIVNLAHSHQPTNKEPARAF